MTFLKDSFLKDLRLIPFYAFLAFCVLLIGSLGARATGHDDLFEPFDPFESEVFEDDRPPPQHKKRV